MSTPLRQATSQVIILPRQIAEADFKAELTALTIANTDIKIWKNAATTLASKNSGGGTHIANGVYYCTLDATDTSAVGPLRVLTHVATAMSTDMDFIVLDPVAYDSLYAANGTDFLQVDERQIAGSTPAATRQMQMLINAINGSTVAASPAPTTTSFAGALTGSSYPDNCFRNAAIVFTSGTLASLTPHAVTAFTSSSGLFTVPTLPFTPVAGDTFLIIGTTA